MKYIFIFILVSCSCMTMVISFQLICHFFLFYEKIKDVCLEKIPDHCRTWWDESIIALHKMKI